MKIEVIEQGCTVVVSVSESVMQEDVPVLRSTLDGLLAQQVVAIVLDLCKAVYISSMCLATMLAVQKKIQKMSGELKVAGANGLILRLLETTNLIDKFTMHTTVDDAILSFCTSHASKAQ